MNAQELRTGSERKLHTAVLAVSVVIWAVLVVTIVGLLYGLLLGFFIFAAHALMIAYIKGNAVKLSETQLPGIHRKVIEASRKLGLGTAPDAYVELPFEWPQTPVQARKGSDVHPPIAELLKRKPWLLPRLFSGDIPDEI